MLIHLESYGVLLEQVRDQDLELIRMWRNSPEIARYMLSQGKITPEMQKEWFLRINNNQNYYFMVNYDDKHVGVANIANINYETKIGEPAIYIAYSELQNADVSYRAVLCLNDFAFDIIRLSRLEIIILKENRRAQRFNESIGYELFEKNDRYRHYFLDRPRYLAAALRIKKLLRLPDCA